ncbi:Rne/Rng family ribonuclease [Luteococcus sanguinis]|uniref:Rne/Rng family ribonuclease n=1 Tax=Luteococcus sanguinis TaxID=174038 RepID=A0ABW1X4T0_9ACTN
MLDENTPTDGPATEAEEVPATPPRRRRAASRPAGPPKEVAAPAEVPVTTAAAESAPAQPVVEAAPVAEPPRRSRRATRKAAPPTPIAELPVPVAQTETSATEPTGDATEASRPSRARRTRATRSERSTRSRGATADAQAAEPPLEQPTVAAEQTGQSEVDAALAAAAAAAAERPRRGRRVSKAVANPFAVAVGQDGEIDKAAALQSLAASIAAPSFLEPQAQQASDDQPASDGPVVEDEQGEIPEADTVATETAEVDAPEVEVTDEMLDAAEVEAEAEAEVESWSDDEGGNRRRRRRRGGRRRRRGQDDDSAVDGDSDEDESETDDTAVEEASSEESDDTDSSGRRRRRRRRRRGEDTAGSEDDPSEVVVRVREPRRSRSAADEVTGIDGSTRMEAKKQRRREGRAAGRRRAPILSEAEFLARRESVERRMVIRQGDEYTQIAVIEDGILVEHYVDRASSSSLIGNIYLGRVQNVLPSMEAAFIDIGRGRNAVLYAGEIDWAGFGAAGQDKAVEKVLKSGQTVLVQVSKDPVGAKGARLTSHISLPGRYVVYSPGGHLSGISRKLADTERNRLKDILGDLIGDEASVIVRTAAEGASEGELVRDVNRLKAQWEVIERKKQGSAPQQLYAEPDLTVRIVRDLFTEDFSELVVAGNGGPDDAYEAINGYVTHVAPHLAERLVRWDPEQGDPFSQHRLDEQIAKALERKVYLPSGGSLVIDRTEAMTVIDVNTGKFTGSGGNLEATVTSNNLEAAEEIVRQLRLRDIGGIIVVDFIDMVLPSNRELLLRRLVECLGRDRTRHQVAEVTSLGLVQMTRKKIGTGLAEAFTEECDRCGGRGYVRHDHPVETQAPADGGERSHGRRGRGRNNN